jgi:hypothetical protein
MQNDDNLFTQWRAPTQVCGKVKITDYAYILLNLRQWRGLVCNFPLKIGAMPCVHVILATAESPQRHSVGLFGAIGRNYTGYS